RALERLEIGCLISHRRCLAESIIQKQFAYCAAPNLVSETKEVLASNRRGKERMRKTLAVGLLLLVAACAGTRQYEGPERVPSEIAVLNTPRFHTPFDAVAYLQEIDGRSRGIGLVYRYEFLPGLHLRVAYVQTTTTGDPVCLEFEATSGHSYVLKSAAEYTTFDSG